MSYKVAALYKFTPIDDIEAIRADIYAYAENHAPSICGTILLAPEGINGTIGAHPDDLDKMIAYLDERLQILSSGNTIGEFKYSASTERPFNKFKVRPKKNSSPCASLKPTRTSWSAPMSIRKTGMILSMTPRLFWSIPAMITKPRSAFSMAPSTRI